MGPRESLQYAHFSAFLRLFFKIKRLCDISLKQAMVVIEVGEPSCDGTDGTSRRLAVGSMSQLLTFDPVLLSGNGEGGEGSTNSWAKVARWA